MRGFFSRILYSVILPVRGSSLPIVPFPFPVYQILPSWSGVTVWGFAAFGNEYSETSPVSGLIRPTRLAHCPAHQIDPSGACTGSRALWPSVGTIHSRNVIAALPGTRVGFNCVPGGKLGVSFSPDSAVDSKISGTRDVNPEWRKRRTGQFQSRSWRLAFLTTECGMRTMERSAKLLRGRDLLLSPRRVRNSLIWNCGIRVQGWLSGVGKSIIRRGFD